MKKLLFAAVAAIACASARADLITDYAGLAAAIDAAEDGATIKLKAGTIAFSAPLAVSKGITLSGGWTDESTRADGAMTTLDGENASDILTVSNEEGTFVAERIRFYRGQKHGLTKKASVGAIEFLSCAIEANGRDFYGNNGMGLNLTGKAGATVTVRDCRFAGNVVVNEAWSTGNRGAGVYAADFDRVYIDNTSFITNGVPFGHPNSSPVAQQGMMGTAVYLSNAPLTARNCEFRGNRGVVCYGSSGTLRFEGNCGGSALTNCLFVGNEALHAQETWNKSGCGALYLNMDSASRTVDVTRCTFAYNSSDAKVGPGGINVTKGTLKLSDSIIYGNINRPDRTVGADLMVGADGFVDVSYTLFTSADSASITGDGIAFGKGVIYGDPGFATPFPTVTALMDSNPLRFKLTTADVVVAFDVHEQAGSVAADGGDPSSDYSNEPQANGARVNLGAYGNTPEALATDPETASFGSIAIDFPKGYSKPDVTVTMGASVKGYNAIVTVYSGTGDVGDGTWPYTNVVYGVRPGDSFTVSPGVYLKKGETYKVHAVAWVAGQTDCEKDEQAVVSGDQPPWSGKGGPAYVIHVREGADGKATGENWSDAFPDMKRAFAAVSAEKTEIWVAGTIVYDVTPSAVSPAVSLTIRGGFTGCEESEEERAAGAVSTLDGNYTYDLGSAANAAGCPVTLERLRFYRALTHGFSKTGAGDIAVIDCIFDSNAINQYKMNTGAGLCLNGTADASAEVSGCVFTNNIVVNAEYSGSGSQGAGLYVKTFASVKVEDSRFLNNGVDFTRVYSPYILANSGAQGSAIYASDAPLDVSGCEFRGNRSTIRYGTTGVVRFEGNCSMSKVANCLFVGNEDVHGVNTAAGLSGAILVNMGSTDYTVDVDRCTIAYNVCDSTGGCGGIYVNKGNVSIRNSILFANRRLAGGTSGADLHVAADGRASIAYSLLTADDATSYAGLVPGEGMVYGDPRFVTPPETVNGLIDSGSFLAYKQSAFADVMSFDVHLRAKLGYWLNDGSYVASDEVNSPALDAGDPTADYSNEIDPNGARLNLGAYGNTAQASHSKVSKPEIVAADIIFPADGYSHPAASVTLGGDAGAEYNATVTLLFYNGGGLVATLQYGGVHNGDTVGGLAPVYLQPGSTVGLQVSVEVAGMDPITLDEPIEKPVTGVLPPWYGKGGPANVVHLRAGADGRATGENWTDAFPDIPSALKALKGEKTELWVAGTIVALTESAVYAPEGPVAIRGGFTGVETTAAARPAGGMSTFDGGCAYNPIAIENAAGCDVTVERMRFCRALKYGFAKKASAGSIAFEGCAFENNAPNNFIYENEGSGLGLQLKGTAGAAATIANCVFSGNVITNGEYTSSGCLGGALFVGGFDRAEIVDSLFVTNGIAFVDARLNVGANNGTRGAAIAAKDTPISVCGCRFIGNRATTTWHGSGEIVYLSGACGGSALDHCLFLGNEVPSWNNRTDSTCGTVLVNLSDANAQVAVTHCTFAYNIVDTSVASGGLTVNKGTANVKNSIFFGNWRSNDGTSGEDLHVGADGTANVAYSRFTGDAGEFVSCADGGTTNFSNVSYGDPLLVTDYDFALTNTTVWSSANRVRYNFDAVTNVVSFSAHLRCRAGYVDETTGEVVRFPRTASPAIDAGDPESPYKAEPSPNGCRVNLGFYGNTPWASMSKGGLLILVK